MRTKRIITHTFVYLVLGCCLAVTMFPLVYIFLASFKDVQELMAGGANIMPKKFTMDNYIRAWNAGNFSTYTLNSVIYSTTVSVLAVLFASMLAFCVERRRFPGRMLIYSTYMGSMFVAGVVTIYPIFMTVVRMRLNNTILGLIIATLGGAQVYTMFLISGFLKGIPKELDEAAIIDGCGTFQVYSRVILPVIKPILFVTIMINFQGTWNSYMLPLALTLTNDRIRTLAVGVTQLAATGEGKIAAQWDLLIAGSCMSILPIMLLYSFNSKFFTDGMVSGAVKS